MLEMIHENSLMFIPVLLIVAKLLKKMNFIPEKFHLLILLVLGIAGAIGMNGFSVENIIQGILVTSSTSLDSQIETQIKTGKSKKLATQNVIVVTDPTVVENIVATDPETITKNIVEPAIQTTNNSNLEQQ